MTPKPRNVARIIVCALVGIYALWMLALAPRLRKLAVHDAQVAEQSGKEKEEERIAKLRALTLEQNVAIMKDAIEKAKSEKIAEIEYALDSGAIAQSRAPNSREIQKLQFLLTDLLRMKKAAESVRNSEFAEANAYFTCKASVEKHLKAPATAKYQDKQTGDGGYWQGHDFYFIENITVDAQNSFGAMLRQKMQCQVYCPSQNRCELGKLYEISR